MDMPGNKRSGLLLPNFEDFHTRDIEQARLWGQRVFCDNEIISLQRKDEINAQMYYRKIGGLGVGFMSYGGEITINPSQFDGFYLIQIPLCGSECIVRGSEVTYTSSSVGSVLNAGQQIQLVHGENTEKLILRIERDLLERQAAQYLGHRGPKQVEFDTAMPLDTAVGQRWARTVSWLIDYLGGENIPNSPLIDAQIEQMMVSLLLASQHSNLSEGRIGDERMVAPAFVRRAEAFIEENAHKPIAVSDIAEHVGVSTSSLYTGFRKYRNSSPMIFLKEVRLQRVREQLLSCNAGQVTVTSVAHQWGFAHLGHFATDYKRRFGESPSETLAR
ncbi:helix-turn-helix domain-containing protein [Paraburkholderia sp. CNPSo 3155]|uniref:AraC family transcriptional regulator n=1 Tax=Paraburkholderia atlantica TaxID=2654982 RepID=UPI00128ADFD6|nr:AraC family transcriptional regulator [Paraburkholderia atlantica]MPW05332.1 helix-turn-helix domain-containing protein [Paraburkholderia atlantica]